MEAKIINLNQYKKLRTIELAEDTLDTFITYYDYSGGIDVVDLLRCMDFKILFKHDFERFDEDDVALLSIHRYFIKKYGTEKVIFINTLQDDKIIRYNLAYILGDYMLNYSGENCYEVRRKIQFDDNNIDHMCNLYALNLLMPEDLFLEKYVEFKEHGYSDFKTSDELCDFFQVPYHKIKERYFTLTHKNYKKGTVYSIKKYRK